MNVKQIIYFLLTFSIATIIVTFSYKAFKEKSYYPQSLVKPLLTQEQFNLIIERYQESCVMNKGKPYFNTNTFGFTTIECLPL